MFFWTAFPALVAAYRRRIYGYLVRSGVEPDERDDLFQTIIMRVHRGASNYQPSKPLRPWLFTIAANAVRNHFRDLRGRAAVLRIIDATELDAPDPQPGPERIAEGRETVAWLEGAIAELPDAQRDALVLVTVAGLPQLEAAAALDQPVNTVKTNLRRARLALAQAMIERDTIGEEL